VNELTSARGACASCGAVGELGGQHLYMHPDSPGAVLRCHVCEAALMVLVHAPGRFRIGFQGILARGAQGGLGRPLTCYPPGVRHARTGRVATAAAAAVREG